MKLIQLHSENKIVLIFSKWLIRKLRERGLAFMKTKEFTFVNDCFQKSRNEIIGVFLQPLHRKCEGHNDNCIMTSYLDIPLITQVLPSSSLSLPLRTLDFYSFEVTENYCTNFLAFSNVEINFLNHEKK